MAYLELCWQFSASIRGDLSIHDYVHILNSPEYYNIFSYKSYKYPRKIYKRRVIYEALIKRCSDIDIILYYVLLTRKVTWTKIIAHYICRLLTTDDDIKRFFSFYSHTEIMEIIHSLIYYNKCILYRRKYVCYNFLHNCMATNNDTWVDYILNYMNNHNQKIIFIKIKFQDDEYYFNGRHYELMSIDDKYIQMMRKHNALLHC